VVKNIFNISRTNTAMQLGSVFKSIQRWPQWQQIILTKYNARILPNGINLWRRGHAGNAICPGFREEGTSDHLFLCQGDQISIVFADHMEQIGKHLKIAPRASQARCIQRLIDTTRKGLLHELTEIDDDLTRLQAALGHRALTAGLWHTAWTEIPQQHNSNESRRQLDSWMLALITKVQNLILDLWYTRNEIMHKTEENLNNIAQHMELNLRIDNIYRRKPHYHLLTHAEVIYFTRRAPQALKPLQLQKKKDWVSGAEVILEQ
jgi:hypothetical protein